MLSLLRDDVVCVRTPRRDSVRASALAALLIGGALALVPGVLSAQAGMPGRIAAPAPKPTDAKSARFAFMQALSGVSRNESAFTQQLDVATGCQATITQLRRERADSVRIVQKFDAAKLTAAMSMKMDQDGGIIHFIYPTVGAAPLVSRERTVIGAPAVAPERRTELTILVAETSQQIDVTTLIGAWRAFVAACGGDASAP